MSMPGASGEARDAGRAQDADGPLLQAYPSIMEVAGKWRTINLIFQTLILLVTQDPAKQIKYSDIQ